jgi:hypothetical protein
MLSNISDLFTMASLVICMLLSGIIFYYLRTRINMLEQSVMDQAHLLQQVVTSIKSSQFRQMTANATVSQQNSQNDQCPVENSNSKLNLIQVSDDDDDSSGDDDDDDESTSCESNDYDDDDDNNNINGSSKIIDLSAITSSSLPISSSSYSSKHDDIKIIELKSSIKLNDEDESDDDDDEDDDDEDDDDEDEDDDDDDEDEDDDTDADVNDAHANDAHANDADANHADANHADAYADTKNKISNTSINNNHKKFKSIVIEDITNSTASNYNSSSISLDEMKNMPVNTLRNLAKTKLNNVDPPTINKMSKKEILKALNE